MAISSKMTPLQELIIFILIATFFSKTYIYLEKLAFDGEKVTCPGRQVLSILKYPPKVKKNE